MESMDVWGRAARGTAKRGTMAPQSLARGTSDSEHDRAGDTVAGGSGKGASVDEQGSGGRLSCLSSNSEQSKE